jgi:hypothetical protein
LAPQEELHESMLRERLAVARLAAGLFRRRGPRRAPRHGRAARAAAAAAVHAARVAECEEEWGAGQEPVWGWGFEEGLGPRQARRLAYERASPRWPQPEQQAERGARRVACA